MANTEGGSLQPRLAVFGSATGAAGVRLPRHAKTDSNIPPSFFFLRTRLPPTMSAVARLQSGVSAPSAAPRLVLVYLCGSTRLFCLTRDWWTLRRAAHPDFHR